MQPPRAPLAFRARGGARAVRGLGRASGLRRCGPRGRRLLLCLLLLCLLLLLLARLARVRRGLPQQQALLLLLRAAPRLP